MQMWVYSKDIFFDRKRLYLFLGNLIHSESQKFFHLSEYNTLNRLEKKKIFGAQPIDVGNLTGFKFIESQQGGGSFNSRNHEWYMAYGLFENNRDKISTIDKTDLYKNLI